MSLSVQDAFLAAERALTAVGRSQDSTLVRESRAQESLARTMFALLTIEMERRAEAALEAPARTLEAGGARLMEDQT